jgi:hypothetical protein
MASRAATSRRPVAIVVEEEQRFGTLDDKVVDRHGDKVDADGRCDAGVDGDLQLGADTIIGRHKDRIREAAGLEVEQPAEAAEGRIRTLCGAWTLPAA